MSWNQVFDYFIEIKHTIGENFNYETPFKELAEKFATQQQYNRIEGLKLNQHNDFLLIKYGDYNDIFTVEQSSVEAYWDLYGGFYRECRSLVIDLKKEEMVLTPYAKFLNMNETEQDSQENIMKRIAKVKVFEVSNKLDGSMVSARYYHDDYVVSTSESLNAQVSWRLQQAYDFLSEDIKLMLKENQACTFIFELISKEDCHVVQYEQSQYGLHLIGIRNTETGEPYNYHELQEIAGVYNVRRTEVENLTFEQMLESLKTIVSTDKEGYVLNIDGYRVKCKGDDYCSIHRLLSSSSSPKTIIQAISKGSFDDLISKIPASHKQIVLDIYDKVHRYKTKMTQEIEQNFELISGLPEVQSKKDFMLAAQKHCDKRVLSYVINKYTHGSYNLLVSRNGQVVAMKTIEEYLES